MGNLSACRILQLKPFLNTGVVSGGPYFIAMNRYRGAKTCKVYLCLFVGIATKAFHRRGRRATLYNDCGTNFVEATELNSQCFYQRTY